MSKIKLVMSDVDGTLLNSENEISELTKDAVQRLVKSGVEFGLATGRNYDSAASIVEKLGLDPFEVPIVSLNGFWVDHGSKDYIFRDETIDYETSKLLGAIGEKYFMGVLYFFEHKVYSHMDDLSLEDYEISKGESELRFFKDDHDLERVDSIEDIKHVFDQGHKVLKIVFVQDEDYTELVKERISKQFPEEYDLLMVAGGWAEIMPKSINKGEAILEYAKFRNLDPSEILCFGDSENDLTMIKYLGTGVAMKNARNSLKILANDITDSNDDHGVARYLEKHILNDD